MYIRSFTGPWGYAPVDRENPSDRPHPLPEERYRLLQPLGRGRFRTTWLAAILILMLEADFSTPTKNVITLIST